MSAASGLFLVWTRILSCRQAVLSGGGIAWAREHLLRRICAAGGPGRVSGV